MAFKYRSPLEDEYYEDNPKDRVASSALSKMPSSYHHKNREWVSSNSLPYSRPGSSSTQVQPKYSSRFKLSSFPKELNDQFGALECKLCVVEVTSPIVAKMHYSGKQHMKKVKKWLLEWSLRTGNPMPQLEEPVSRPSGDSLPDYCDICHVSFTSLSDKLLHFSGKTHKKNERDPDNAKKKTKAYETIDLSHTNSRFGIGVDFSSEQKPLAIEGVKQSGFLCELCDVKAQTQDQLNMHLNGKKHRDKLVKKESAVPKPGCFYICNLCDVSLNTYNLYQLHITGKRHANNLKKADSNSQLKQIKCEAGSEKWVCAPCMNLVFETEQDLAKHKVTRGHLLCTLNAESDKISEDKKYWYCFTCRKQYNSHRDYTHHLFEQKHMILSAETNMKSLTDIYYCHTCELVLDKATIKEHKFDRRHLRVLCTQEIASKLTKLAVEQINNQRFRCYQCNKDFLTFVSMCNHCLSEEHLEKEIDTALAKLYVHHNVY